MFPCINFDDHFSDFITRYTAANRQRYRNADAVEADVPRIYLEFLNTPADWLGGLTPGSYFTQYEDPKDLVDWLQEYCGRGIPVPDLLLEQIEAVGRPCEKRLLALLKDDNAGEEAKMTAIGLLRSMESTLPKMLYIDWQLQREEDDDLADNGAESLAEMGRSVIQPVLEAVPKANDAGQQALLDVLMHFPSSEPVFRLALRMFREHPEKRSLFASYLGKLEDPRALPDLLAAANDPALGYVDYVEVRAAIERLGGEAPERSFDEDPEFWYMKSLDQ